MNKILLLLWVGQPLTFDMHASDKFERRHQGRAVHNSSY